MRFPHWPQVIFYLGYNCNLTLLDTRSANQQPNSLENQSNSVENKHQTDSMTDNKESDELEDDIPF